MNQTFTKEQQLLIDEIINKGYNQEDFEQFVLSKEPQKGYDLSEWTFTELQAIITLFQQQRSESPIPGKSRDSEPDSPGIFEQFQNLDKDYLAQKQKQEPIKINDKLQIYPYSKIVNCKTLNYLIDEQQELQIEVGLPIEERGGILDFFSKTIVFPIAISPFNWKVKRTLQDFAQFRKILCAALPETVIPSFPYNNVDDYEIIIREQENIVKVLQTFLQIFNKKLIVRTIPASLIFLSEENSKQFQNKFYKEQSLQKSFTLNQKQTQTGAIKFEFNEYQFQKFKDYSLYLQSEQGNYDLIQKHLEQFSEFTYRGQQSLGFSIEMIQQLCLSLPQYLEAQQFETTLSLLKTYFQTQKDFVLRQTRQVTDILLITLIKFRNWKQPIFELKNNLNETFQNFSNEYFLLEKRKEELFTLKDSTKWGLNSDILQSIDISKCYTDIKYAKEVILPKESFYVQEKKDQYIYMLNNFNTSFDQQFLIETEKLAKDIEIYLENMRQYTDNQLHNWTFLIQEFEEYKSQLQL